MEAVSPANMASCEGNKDRLVRDAVIPRLYMAAILLPSVAIILYHPILRDSLSCATR